MLYYFKVSSKVAQLYMHMSTLLDYFPIYIIAQYWVEFHVLYSRSLFIYFIYSGVYMLILSF